MYSQVRVPCLSVLFRSGALPDPAEQNCAPKAEGDCGPPGE